MCLLMTVVAAGHSTIAHLQTSPAVNFIFFPAPPPPPCIVSGWAQRFPRTPEGTNPNDGSLTPPITMQRTRDTKQVMQTRRHTEHKMSQELPVGMHVQLYSKTDSVCHFFWQEYLTLKSCTCSTGARGMASPAAGWAAGLAATWAAGLAALLVEGLARGLAALGAGLAGGLAGGSCPCGKQFCLRNIAREVQFFVGKNSGQPPYTTRTLCIIGRSGGARPFWEGLASELHGVSLIDGRG